MKIKFELNNLSTDETTTQELWFNVFDFGTDFNVKRICAINHCSKVPVEIKGYKKIDDGIVFGRTPNSSMTLMSLFIPEWVDKDRWMFIYKLCCCANDIEIINLSVKDFLLWLEGKDIHTASNCHLNLDGLNAWRSLKDVYELSQR